MTAGEDGLLEVAIRVDSLFNQHRAWINVARSRLWIDKSKPLPFQIGDRFQPAVLTHDNDPAISRGAFNDRLRDDPNLPTPLRIYVCKRREAPDVNRSVFHLRSQ